MQPVRVSKIEAEGGAGSPADGLNRKLPASGSSLINRLKPSITFLNLLCLAVLLFYLRLFWNDLAAFWFNPDWTTDDALQQIYPFHKVFHPEIFRGDLITEVMEGYLAPLHYWICYGITWLTGDPVMMGHWVMLLQLVLAAGFLFFAVKHAAGTAPALLSVVWLLHTRPVMQRITSGLPRGWSAVVLAAFFYFAMKKNHKAMLAALLCGCLLHPPTTLIAAAAYGMLLIFGALRKNTRAQYLKPLIILIILSPIYAFITWKVVQRPAHIGQMVDYQTASAMPEFQRPHGRFPFLPLDQLSWDAKMYAYQPFFHRLFRPGLSWNGEFHSFKSWKKDMAYLIPLVLLIFLFWGWYRGNTNYFAEPLFLLAAILLVYFASRQIPFKLYVPNRHLQFPMTFFWIAAFCIIPWRIFRLDRAGQSCPECRLRTVWPAALVSLLLAGLVFIGSGDGLYGTANFNYSLKKKGNVFAWIRKNTPESALFAGHPTHIDALMLFGMRRAFATTETTHPFYPPYYYEIKRRLIISLKAHYARNLSELLEILEPEGIDYFIFSRKRFYPDALKEEQFFSPLDVLVNELTSRNYLDYAYKQLPARVNLKQAPYMPFKDDQSAVVDLKKLKAYLLSKAAANTTVAK